MCVYISEQCMMGTKCRVLSKQPIVNYTKINKCNYGPSFNNHIQMLSSGWFISVGTYTILLQQKIIKIHNKNTALNKSQQ